MDGVSRSLTLAVLLAMASVSPGYAQQPPPQPPPAGQVPAPVKPSATMPSGELRVFLDCQYECDFDYLRKEITFVDHVRDSQSADIHALITTETTGSGGWNWKVQLIGLGRFEGHDDLLTFSTAQTDSSDTRRKTLARWLKLGLATHAAKVHGKPDLDVVHSEAPATDAPAAPTRDPWDNWVFNIGTNGNLNGEASSAYNSYRVNVSGSRVTDDWKISLSANGNRNSNRFELSDGDTVESVTRSWSSSGLVVKSLTGHWSAATRGTLSQSTFSNYDLVSRVLAGVEYDIFPYTESTRRSLTFMYMVGVAHYDFETETIFDKLAETHLEHNLGASLGLRQPWGSLGIQSNLTQQLDDPGKYRFSSYGDADVRLFKGFSFNIYGSYSKIRDQINLRKGQASDEEVLLRQRQLATGYSYGVGFGVSYRFGSIFNNVVNPRFRSFF